MAGLFEAHVTNLGKYNEGVLAGEPLSFPASPQAVQALLKDIGVDGIRYEEIFIASYDFGGILPELSEHLGEYESLDELNHLACLLSEMAPDDFEKFGAALSMGTHTSSLADIINLAENLEYFEFYPDIENEDDFPVSPACGPRPAFWKGEMSLPKNQTDRTDCKIELPQAVIETFARFLVPEIRKYYDSEQGQREFAEWQEAQRKIE